MIGSLATVWAQKGYHPQAEILFEEVLVGMKARLGDEHVDTLRMMGHLARLYQQEARYVDAEQRAKQTLGIKPRFLDQETHLHSRCSQQRTKPRAVIIKRRIFKRVVNDIETGDGSP